MNMKGIMSAAKSIATAGARGRSIMVRWRIELVDKSDPEYVEADTVSQDRITGDYVFSLKEGAGKVAIYSKVQVKSVRRED